MWRKRSPGCEGASNTYRGCLKQQESQHPTGMLAFGGNNRLLGLVQRAQAASTHVETFGSLTVSNCNPLDVGQPTTICRLFGVAYVVAKLWTFSTNITSYWHSKLPLSSMDKILEMSSHNTTRSHFVQVLPVGGLPPECCQSRVPCNATCRRVIASDRRERSDLPFTRGGDSFIAALQETGAVIAGEGKQSPGYVCIESRRLLPFGCARRNDRSRFLTQ